MRTDTIMNTTILPCAPLVVLWVVRWAMAFMTHGGPYIRLLSGTWSTQNRTACQCPCPCTANAQCMYSRTHNTHAQQRIPTAFLRLFAPLISTNHLQQCSVATARDYHAVGASAKLCSDCLQLPCHRRGSCPMLKYSSNWFCAPRLPIMRER